MLFVTWFEHAAKQRLYTEDIEEIPRDDAGFDAFGFAASQQNELHVVVFDDAIHAAALRAIVVEFGDRRAADANATMTRSGPGP